MGSTMKEFNDLPDNVFLHLFSFLNPEDWLVTRNVCHRWRELTSQKSLWSNTKVDYSCRNNSKKLLPFLRTAPTLKHLKLESLNRNPISPLSREVVASILKYRPVIKELHLENCVLKKEEFANMVNCLADHLEKLHLFRTTISDETAEDKYPVTGTFPNLRSLRLSNGPKFFFWHPVGLHKADWPKLEEVLLGTEYSYLVEKNNVEEYFPSAKDQLKSLHVDFEELEFLQKFDVLLFPKLERVLIDYKPWGQKCIDSGLFFYSHDQSSNFTIHIGSMILIHSKAVNSDCQLLQRIVDPFKSKNVRHLMVTVPLSAVDCVEHLLKGFQLVRSLTLGNNCSKWGRNADGSAYELSLDFFCRILSLFPKLKKVSIVWGHVGFIDPDGNVIRSLRKRFPKVRIETDQVDCECSDASDEEEEEDTSSSGQSDEESSEEDEKFSQFLKFAFLNGTNENESTK